MIRLPRSTILTTCVALLLAVHASLALHATFRLGVTADETAHLTGGYSYWRFNDYRLQPENGNLPQRWAALPLLAQDPRLEPGDIPLAWNTSHVWLIGQHFFFESGNNTDFLLLTARSAMILWSIATGLLVFFWSRSLWGDHGALFSLALYALSPTALAHGPLVTSDMCATFFLIAATGAWWRTTQQVNAQSLAISLVVTGLASVAKFSFVLLIPTFGLLLAWRVVSDRPVKVGQQRILNKWREKLLFLGGLGLVHGLAIWVTIWLFFGFRYNAFAPGVPEGWSFFADWEHILPNHGARRAFFDLARTFHFFPEAYLQGFAFVLSASEARGAFLAGNYSTTGWWWFFPYAFLIKSTLAEVFATIALLAGMGAVLLPANRRRLLTRLPALAPLLVFAAVYGVVSLTSNLNIGHRHILPLYPVLFILIGALARTSLGVKGQIFAFVLTVLTAVESFAVRPHYLAFFNRLIGGSAEGWRHLADSSLDWGQNSPLLAEWLAANRKPGEATYISMFGSDYFVYHGAEGKELAPMFNFGRPRQWIELKEGLYCISTTMLQEVYSPLAGEWTADYEKSYQYLLPRIRREIASGERSPEIGHAPRGQQHPLWNLDRARFARLCLYLRTRRPEAVLGHSIFIFRLDDKEVRIATEGSMSELIDLMEAASQRRSQGN